MADIIVAIITGIATITAVVITNKSSNREITHKLETHQAVTDTKIDALTAEVKSHNNFAQRMPVVEEQIQVINHRLEDLEHESKNR